MTKFIIGHSAYSGTNRLTLAGSHQSALGELLSRGVKMSDAQKALKAAKSGSHAIASRFTRDRAGVLRQSDGVEVITPGYRD